MRFGLRRWYCPDEMADKSSGSKPLPLNPSLPAWTFRYLRILRRSGLHGSTESAVARTLIQDAIKALIREGALKMEFDESAPVPGAESAEEG